MEHQPPKRRGRPPRDPSGRQVNFGVAMPPSLLGKLREGVEGGRWPSISAALVDITKSFFEGENFGE